MSLQIILVLCMIAVFQAKPLYNPSKSYVSPITMMNWENQVNKIRQTTRFVTVIHFYKNNDGVSKNFAQQYQDFAQEYNGAFRVSACDCDSDAAVCEKERITQFPTVRVYPPLPIPSIDVEGEINQKSVMNLAAKFLEANIIEITNANINKFIEENPAVPKCFLFTEQKGFPLIFKGLSIAFQKKIFFGIVRKEDDVLISRYQIQSFPSIIIVQANEPQPIRFSGEFQFTPLHDWLNIYSEVFVPGGGSSADSSATKEWLTLIVPELTNKSANDICLKTEGVLCVILFNNGKPEQKLIESFEALNSAYDRKIQRGGEFKFMWIDASIQKSWVSWLQVENTPSVVVLNPAEGKMRYLIHEGDIALNSIQNTIEQINGGDARFIRIKDSVPSLSSR